jgi:hypothetical protein
MLRFSFPKAVSCLLFLVFSFTAGAQHATDLAIFLDQWHLAASEANAKRFFDGIAEEGIYIGTADHERWTKPEFIKFATPYFKRGRAWDFKAFDRQIQISPDGQYAWFSELLTTWMGVCRGSGILIKKPDGWKILQYHLAVTVPNEIIDDFIKLVDGFNKEQKK